MKSIKDKPGSNVNLNLFVILNKAVINYMSRKVFPEPAKTVVVAKFWDRTGPLACLVLSPVGLVDKESYLLRVRGFDYVFAICL